MKGSSPQSTDYPDRAGKTPSISVTQQRHVQFLFVCVQLAEDLFPVAKINFKDHFELERRLYG